MDKVAKPRETKDDSISPSTVVKGVLAFGIVALLIASLSRQEDTRNKFTEKITILETRMQNLEDTIAMMHMSNTNSKPKERSNVFVNKRKRKVKKYDF